MRVTTSTSNLEPPEWPHCGRTDNPSDDPVGCRGARVPGADACLSHVAPEARAHYFSTLHSLSLIDHRGTEFTDWLFRELFQSLQNANEAELNGVVDLSESRFTGEISLSEISLGRKIYLTECQFSGHVRLDRAHFTNRVYFSNSSFLQGLTIAFCTFTGEVNFFDCTISDQLTVIGGEFREDFSAEGIELQQGALFSGVKFDRIVGIPHAQGRKKVTFSGSTFSRTIWLDDSAWESLNFYNSTFQARQSMQNFTCTEDLNMNGSRFAEPLTLNAKAARVDLSGVQLDSAATLRLSSASVDLSNLIAFQPVSISHPSDPSQPHTYLLRVKSLHGADCAMLTLTDVSLDECLMAGALHLDQISLEGIWSFADAPKRRFYGLLRYTQRMSIEEERRWRASVLRPALLRKGWGDPPARAYDFSALPALAIIYRQLRKAREDAKDEPGAADFYYGEMEMRRHSKGWRTAERWLLQLYWILSGYGLRASRALAWLALAMMATILLMMGFGLPQSSPKMEAVSTTSPNKGRVTFEIDKESPKNPTGDHFTGERFDKALSVTLNSVVFRSSGEELTTAGGYIEMASRLSEPVLLGLAALAIRGRVKR